MAATLSDGFDRRYLHEPLDLDLPVSMQMGAGAAYDKPAQYDKPARYDKPAQYAGARGPEVRGVPRVAPRSRELFRVGPPFGATVVRRALFTAHSQPVTPHLAARLDRGFELGDAGNWIGYKRNYFTLVLAFTFNDWDLEQFLAHSYYVETAHGRVPVRYFALSVRAQCSDPNVAISLVQHTPKRDKGPQYAVPAYAAVPGNLPDHQTVKLLCNKRNGSKLESLSKIFHYDERAAAPAVQHYPPERIVRVARFERIQFSASIRVRATHVNQKYYTLNVDLLAVVEGAEPVALALVELAPLLVRGRLPSSYLREKTSGFRAA